MLKHLSRRLVISLIAPCLLAVLLVSLFYASEALAGHTPPGTYVNPVLITIPGSANVVQSFADPSVIRGNDGYYYAYATKDPLNDADRDPNGNLKFHNIPMARSADMVHWTYLGDVFPVAPSWVVTTSGLFAPDIRYMNGLYYLYYTATDVQDSVSGEPGCGSDNAIGVATSPNPSGPWTDIGRPVVYPRRAGGGCNFFWTFDPALITDDNGQRYIYFGSYYGGIKARRLSKDGTSTDPVSEVDITIPNRYEGAYVVRHGGYYYLFASATNCCNGPLTGYSVFAGRSTTPLGPFVDRLGVSLLDTRVGGSPVISMNGNKWMGPGHNAVFTDLAGQDWFFYHAIDRNDPYFAAPNPFTINKRPMLMDRLDWINGWPTVRAEYWASDSPQPAPAATASATPQPTPPLRPIDVPAGSIQPQSDEFNGALEPQWRWVRQPPTSTYSLTEHPGFLRFRTQRADLYQDNNSASVLTETAPSGDFMVEAKFEFNLPPTGCCQNYQQAGLLLYQDDNNYVKLAHVSIWETRQTEWAKEMTTDAGPRYGNTVIGPPGQPEVMTTTTWLRIVKRTDQATGQQYYTGYNSFNGINWYRGATWTHSLSNIKIGLVSMGRCGDCPDPEHIADFDYVRVYKLAPTGGTPSSTATTAVGTGTSTPGVPTLTQTSTRTAIPVASGTATATTCTMPFTDVPTSNIFYAYIKYMYCHGVISGYNTSPPCVPGGVPCFLPSNPTTRGQVSKIATLAFGFAINTTGGPHFHDVNQTGQGSTFYPYIETLYNKGAISGYSGSQANRCTAAGVQAPCFLPDNPVSRGQIAKIVVNSAAQADPSHWQIQCPTTATFQDVPVGSTFFCYVETAYSHGILSGYCANGASSCPPGSPKVFRPDNNATRAQISKIVYLAVVYAP